jgi:Phage integrase family
MVLPVSFAMVSNINSKFAARLPSLIQSSPDTFLWDVRVAPSTLSTYKKNLKLFLNYLEESKTAEDALLFITTAHHKKVDAAFGKWLHVYFRSRGDGSGRGNAQHAFSGLLHQVPDLRGHMVLSDLALEGWRKLVIVQHHPPMSWSLACVVALRVAADVNSVSGKRLLTSSRGKCSPFRLGVGVLVAWDAYLRVGELLALRANDVLFHEQQDMKSDGKSVVVSLRLRFTKTGTDMWAQIGSPSVAYLLRFLVQRTPSDGLLFGCSKHVFRSFFHRACESLSLSPRFVPHSLRHGHATHDYEHKVPVNDIMVRGRWRHQSALTIYVQSGPALLVAYQPRPDIAALASRISRDPATSLLTILKRFYNNNTNSSLGVTPDSNNNKQ